MKKLTIQLLIGLLFITSGFSENLYADNANETSKELSVKQQNIIPIAAYTAVGDLEKLKPALNDGLDAGLTINEIKEAIVHLYAYCGFPRSIRGLQTFMEVLDERKANERGKANLEALIGRSLDGPQTGYAAFAPVIEIFLKEHLFADIFDRDVLTYAERELVTVSVISAIGNAEPMLRSHLTICLNVGYSPEQLQEFVGIIKSTIGKKAAKNAQAVLDEILENK
jgi:alkylhydroperoxidase/carboxymuconolactone decarboxylase family protein YurZ